MQGAGPFAQFRGEVFRPVVHVDPDPHHQVVHPVRLSLDFGQDSGNFATARQQVVRPFHPEGHPCPGGEGSGYGRGHGQGQRGGSGRDQLPGTQQQGEPQPFSGWRAPGTTAAPPPCSLRFGYHGGPTGVAFLGQAAHRTVGGVHCSPVNNPRGGQLLRAQPVRLFFQEVAQPGRRPDGVSLPPQRLYLLPDRGAADLQPAADLPAGEKTPAAPPQDAQDLRP